MDPGEKMQNILRAGGSLKDIELQVKKWSTQTSATGDKGQWVTQKFLKDEKHSQSILDWKISREILKIFTIENSIETWNLKVFFNRKYFFKLEFSIEKKRISIENSIENSIEKSIEIWTKFDWNLKGAESLTYGRCWKASRYLTVVLGWKAHTLAWAG